MLSKREKKAIAAKIDLLEAVGSALKKYGFAKLGINLVAAEAKMDKTAIYRYYSSIEELLKAYIEKQDYWLTSLKEYGNKEIKDRPGFTKSFFKEQIEILFSNEELQQLIIWEIADKDKIAAPITVKREIYSQGLLRQGRDILSNYGINFNHILSILLGGVYYGILHKDKGAFCELDLTQKKHKEDLTKTIEWLIDLVFSASEEMSEIEKIAIRAYKKGLSINDIIEITGLSEEKLNNLF